jgi:nitroreductase
MLEAAMAAPSACARDPWRFVVVRDPAGLNRIADGLPNGQMLRQAQVGIAVCGDLEATHDKQLSFCLQDCSAAIENLLLAASALGLGTCWLGVHPREERMRHVREVLRIPEQVLPISVIAIGIPAEQKEARTRYNPAFVKNEQYG